MNTIVCENLKFNIDYRIDYYQWYKHINVLLLQLLSTENFRYVKLKFRKTIINYSNG